MAASGSGLQVNTVAIAFTSIASLFVFFRIFTRAAVIKKLGPEDALIIMSTILIIGYAIAVGEQVRNGLGKHLNELDDATITNTLKAFWASVWMYNLSLTTTKISILLQYLQVFPTRQFRIACLATLVFVGAYGVWTLFGSIFLCSPVPFFWDKTIEGGTCLNQSGVWFTNAAINILQDFLILLMPMPVVRRLDIPRGQKKALVIVFAAGGIVCIISIARLHSLVAISNSDDPTYDNGPAAALSGVEANVAIIAACLPFLRPLVNVVRNTFSNRAQQSMELPPEYVEPPKQHSRSQSLQSRPTTAASKYSHRSTKSDISDLSALRSPPIPRVARTGSRIFGPVRQVTIQSNKNSPIVDPLLPRVPENIALMSPLQLDGHTNTNRFSLKILSPKFGKQRPKTPKTPHTPGAQKPLPATPLPTRV